PRARPAPTAAESTRGPALALGVRCGSATVPATGSGRKLSTGPPMTTARSSGPRTLSIHLRKKPRMTSDTPQGEPVQPPPFTLEAAAYAVIVSECAGLQRAGADPLGAALITAAHLLFLGLAGAGQQQAEGDV